jgi:hypothetical protein
MMRLLKLGYSDRRVTVITQPGDLRFGANFLARFLDL